MCVGWNSSSLTVRSTDRTDKRQQSRTGSAKKIRTGLLCSLGLAGRGRRKLDEKILYNRVASCCVCLTDRRQVSYYYDTQRTTTTMILLRTIILYKYSVWCSIVLIVQQYSYSNCLFPRRIISLMRESLQLAAGSTPKQKPEGSTHLFITASRNSARNRRGYTSRCARLFPATG